MTPTADQVHSLTRRIKAVRELVEVLTRDLQDMAPAVSAQLSRRNYVRAAFAHIEGTLSGLKAILIEAWPIFGADLNTGEQALLFERKYSLDDHGSVRSQEAFSRLASNIRFTLALGIRIFGLPLMVVYSDENWAALKASVVLRNRLVHPQDVAALNVTDEELQALNKATLWFRDRAIELLLGSVETIEARQWSEP